MPIDSAKSLPDLKRFELFEDLKDAELALVAEKLEEFQFPAGTAFIKENEHSHQVYFVTQGRVEVKISLVGPNEAETLATIPPYSPIGEFAIIRQGRRTATARARDHIKGYSAEAKDLLRLFDDHPRIGYLVMRNLCLVLVNRLQDTNMLARNALSQGI